MRASRAHCRHARGSPTITGRRVDDVVAGGLRPPARIYASRGYVQFCVEAGGECALMAIVRDRIAAGATEGAPRLLLQPEPSVLDFQAPERNERRELSVITKSR